MYFFTVVVALALDFLTDRSGGALSLCTLVISAISSGCFLIGQIVIIRPFRLYIYWIVGKALIFAGLLAFAVKGADAPKDGELVFTYAMLISSPPSSLLFPLLLEFFPLLPEFSKGHDFDTVVARSAAAWIMVFFLGNLQWIIVRWVTKKISCKRKETQEKPFP